MDNLGDIFTYCQYKVNRDQRGEPFTPEQFNVLLRTVNYDFFVDEWNVLVQFLTQSNKVSGLDTFMLNTPLRPLLAEYSLPIVSEEAVLPSGCEKIIGGKAFYDNEEIVYPIKFVTPDEFYRRQLNHFNVELLQNNPIGTIIRKTTGDEDIVLRVVPYPEDVVVSCVKSPTSPVFDYCFTQAFSIVFMPVGSRLLEVGAVVNLIDPVSGKTLATNVNHPTATPPYTSVTVEMDWSKLYYKNIADRIVKLAYFNAKEFDALQIQKMEDTRK